MSAGVAVRSPARDYDLGRDVLERVAIEEGATSGRTADRLERRDPRAVIGWLLMLRSVGCVRTDSDGIGWHVTDVGDLALIWLDGPMTRARFADAVRRARARVSARRRFA